MKKILIALCLILVLTGCSSAPQKLTVDSLQAATSREDLAKILNCEITDLKLIVTNLDNLYKNLPETTDESKKSTEVKYNDEGKICIPKDELMGYIERIDITPENWKDIYEVKTNIEEYKNSFGEVTNTYKSIKLQFKDGYIGDSYSAGLRLHDNVNNIDKITDELYLEEYNPEEAYWYDKTFNEGDILYNVYDEKNYCSNYYVFDINNFTCTQTIGHVYKLSIPEEYITEEDYGDGYIEKYVICYYTESGYEEYQYVYLNNYSLDDLFEN